MASITENIARTIDAFDNIKNAINTKGVSVTNEAVEDYSSKINDIDAKADFKYWDGYWDNNVTKYNNEADFLANVRMDASGAFLVETPEQFLKIGGSISWGCVPHWINNSEFKQVNNFLWNTDEEFANNPRRSRAFSGAGWSVASKFYGIYNGNGCINKNVYLKSVYGEPIYGFIGNGCTTTDIVNLVIENIKLDAFTTDNSNMSTIAYSCRSLINCKVSNAVFRDYTQRGTSFSKVGGLAFEAFRVTNCCIDFTCDINTSGSVHVGGLVTQTTNIMTDEYYYGSYTHNKVSCNIKVVTTSTSEVYVGGLVAVVAYTCYISKNFVRGDIDVDAKTSNSAVSCAVGGLIGMFNASNSVTANSFEYNIYKGNISLYIDSASTFVDFCWVGGLIGRTAQGAYPSYCVVKGNIKLRTSTAVVSQIRVSGLYATTSTSIRPANCYYIGIIDAVWGGVATNKLIIGGCCSQIRYLNFSGSIYNYFLQKFSSEVETIPAGTTIYNSINDILPNVAIIVSPVRGYTQTGARQLTFSAPLDVDVTLTYASNGVGSYNAGSYDVPIYGIGYSLYTAPVFPITLANRSNVYTQGKTAEELKIWATFVGWSNTADNIEIFSNIWDGNPYPSKWRREVSI